MEITTTLERLVGRFDFTNEINLNLKSEKEFDSRKVNNEKKSKDEARRTALAQFLKTEVEPWSRKVRIKK